MFSSKGMIILQLFVIGFLVRCIFIFSSLSVKLGNRVEISTPLNSWKRVVEGVTLKKQGVLSYDGDIFHESPLSLLFYEFSICMLEEWTPLLFVICDLMTSALLALAAKKFVQQLVEKEGKTTSYPPSAIPLLVTSEKVQNIPVYVAAIYLFCPYSLASCIGRSTTVFMNMILAATACTTMSGRWLEATLLLSMASYHSFYPLMLIVPLVMCTAQIRKQRILPTSITTGLLFILANLCLLLISYKLTGSWRFLWSTYGCILSVPDLAPNIGLFWYFFTEMFEHFRLFFVWTFQLNSFIYTLPLAIRLRREPMFLFCILLLLMAIFKSYPSIGDVALYLALLPLWSHLFPYMRQSFLVGCVLVSCTFLAPFLWHLWIYAGSANANFYFGITLAFNTGQIFLVTDLLSAFIKRDYYLLHDVKTESTGDPPRLELRGIFPIKT